MPKKKKTETIERRETRALAQAYRDIARLDPDFEALRKLPGDHIFSRSFLTQWQFSDFFQQPPDSDKTILKCIFSAIEEEAKLTLWNDLPPGISEDLQEVNENELFKRRVINGQRRVLNMSQIGALSMLAQSARLKKLLNLGKVSASQPLVDAAHRFFNPTLVMGKDGRWRKYRPPLERLSRGEMVRRAALQGMQFAWAAIRGDLRENLWPNIKHGAPFRNAPKKNRRDNLSREMERMIREKAPKEIWADFEKKAGDGKIIREVTDDAVQWEGANGSIRTTSKKTFLNRCSAMKKRLNLPKVRSSAPR